MEKRLKEVFLKDSPRLYLAGKVRPERYRWGRACWQFTDEEFLSAPVIPPVNDGITDATGRRFGFTYTGPFVFAGGGGHVIEDDHGCGAYEANLHDGSTVNRGAVKSRSLAGIGMSDAVIAFVDSTDCFGTMTEIGYAAALRRPIVVMAPKGIDTSDLWFPLECATLRLEVESPADGLLGLFHEARKGRFAGFDTYDDYLRSEHWQAVRRDALARAGDKCQLCASPLRLHVHHNSYERLGHEEPTDVVVLCWLHHMRFHDIKQPEAA